MKLFYHLFGTLLCGMVIMIGVDEYLSFRVEVNQFEVDMVTNALQTGNSISGMIAHTWKESGEDKALELLEDASTSGTIPVRWVWADDFPDDATVVAAGEKNQLEDLDLHLTTTLKMHDRNGKPFCTPISRWILGLRDMERWNYARPFRRSSSIQKEC